MEPRREPKYDAYGKRLCHWCHVGYPPTLRHWYCSQACKDEYNIRTSGSYAREKVLERDKGVCRGCGLQAEKLQLLVRRLSDTLEGSRLVTKRTYRRLNGHRGWRNGKAGPIALRRANELLKLYSRVFPEMIKPKPDGGWDVSWRAWWEMDHIVPVHKGGGGCGLNNLQTLCVWCHRFKTAYDTRRTTTAV